MSENATGQQAALNWRGPLLAAGIFAGVFAILLLMARQNQSNTSDEGSSLRQDPYGASLLFDSYERAGYQVNRSAIRESLADQNASRTTAFFIGGYQIDVSEMNNGNSQVGSKSRDRVDDFLSRGGRVVLIEPGWGLTMKLPSQGWQVEEKWNKSPLASGPAWVAADPRSMPHGSENMYLLSDSPWLQTGAQWTTLYRGPVTPIAGTGAGATGNAAVAAEPPAHVYMAMRRVGKGELIVASQQSFLLNEAIKTHPNPVLLDFLAGGRPVIWVDETLHGLYQNEGVLWLVQRYRLEAALLLFWASLLALLWSMSGDLVRRPARDRSAEIVRHGESAGAAGQRLLQRSVPSGQVVAECWEQFRRRSPQDAQAISADPQWRARLRTALAEQPLNGYRELMKIIAERRASAKGLHHAGRETHDSSPAAQKKNSEEARIA